MKLLPLLKSEGKLMFKNSKVLIVVAHPDDEILGIGGSIVKLKQSYNATIKVIILGEGLTSRDDSRDVEKRSSELNQHRKCITDAKVVLGYDYLSIYQFPDNRFDSVDLIEIVKIIEKEKQDFKPDFVFTHHEGDLNIDHRLTFEAVITATRPMLGETVKGVFTFETLSSTEWSFNVDTIGFRPNLIISLEEKEIKIKQDAMAKYVFEIRSYPHPRSLEAIKLFNQTCGMLNGSYFAERFKVVRLTV